MKRTKEDLLAELQLNRRALASDLPELARRCNLVTRLRRSLAANPGGWIVASVVTGIVASRLVRSAREESPGSGRKTKSLARLAPALGFLYKTAWSLAKPSTEKLVREQIDGILGGSAPSRRKEV